MRSMVRGTSMSLRVDHLVAGGLAVLAGAAVGAPADAAAQRVNFGPLRAVHNDGSTLAAARGIGQGFRSSDRALGGNYYYRDTKTAGGRAVYMRVQHWSWRRWAGSNERDWQSENDWQFGNTTSTRYVRAVRYTGLNPYATKGRIEAYVCEDRTFPKPDRCSNHWIKDWNY